MGKTKKRSVNELIENNIWHFTFKAGLGFRLWKDFSFK